MSLIQLLLTETRIGNASWNIIVLHFYFNLSKPSYIERVEDFAYKLKG